MAEMTLVVSPRLPISLGCQRSSQIFSFVERVLPHDHLLELFADGLEHLAVVRHAAAESDAGDALVGCDLHDVQTGVAVGVHAVPNRLVALPAIYFRPHLGNLHGGNPPILRSDGHCSTAPRIAGLLIYFPTPTGIGVQEWK